MSNIANIILDQALGLSPVERADVAERLLFSLDSPDSDMDRLWAKEADLRIEAYEKGNLEKVSAEDVFVKYHL